MSSPAARHDDDLVAQAQRVKAAVCDEEGMMSVGDFYGVIPDNSAFVTVYDDGDVLFQFPAYLLDGKFGLQIAAALGRAYGHGHRAGVKLGEVSKAAQIRRALLL